MIGTAVHDFFYQTNVYEYMKMKEGGELEINLGDGPQRVVLNEKDELWNRFKNKHIAEVLNKVNEEVTKMTAES